jgi:hypothetical protein
MGARGASLPIGVTFATLLAFVPAADAAMAVVLQGLDKVTARVSTLEAPLGAEIAFGTLGIIARACIKAPPEEPPESEAFLEIFEYVPDQPPRDLFIGWMFASSPSVSALEHPVYDIWVLDCRDPEAEAQEGVLGPAGDGSVPVPANKPAGPD